jgi:cytochrome P450 family 150 subfamily A5
MNDLLDTNFFRDRAVQDDPYPYYDALRDRSPVWQEPTFGVYMVTGYDEARAVYNDTTNFSSCNTVSGPFQKFSVPLEGDDISDIIEAHRHELPFGDQLPAFDPPRHDAHRALMMRLLTPGRLRANEEFMWRLADRQIDGLVDAGSCEFIKAYAAPFTLLVIADLEGVPESDHGMFQAKLSGLPGDEIEHKPLEFLYEQFSAYIEERRATPRDDIMTAMALATFPDGTTPEVNDVALLAANLFAGGQETTVRLLSFAVRMLAEHPDLQQRLRDDRDLIPNFVEETLRFESPLRAQFRLARRRTTVAGVDIPPGGVALLLPGAANRDPRTFPDAGAFDVDRENARIHVAFGHGVHHCAGAHLARAEGRVTINRLFDRTRTIEISEEHHGPAGDRRYDYLPTYFLRGLTDLHVELTPA